jgi:putative nucleotide binding protein
VERVGGALFGGEIMPNEEFAIVLDYLPTGKSSSFKPEPIAQVIGVNHFTLLEVVPKTQLKTFEKVYIGKDERDKIQYIKKRISFKELTSNASMELSKAIEKIVLENPQRFLDFFNKSGAISIKMHQLELLPGLGKKHMMEILKERKQKPFESFEEIEKRIHLMPNPVQIIVKRILQELQEPNLKHYLFVRPPTEPKFEKKPFFKRKTFSKPFP